MTAQIPESASLLIVGMDSLVGSCLGVEASRLGIPWTGTSRRTGSRWRLDLSESHLKWQIPESSKSVAILCAAVTGIEECESDPQGTASINTTATIALADKLADEGAALVFISSSRVFPSWLDNPSETTPPAPNTEYGRQKLAVEKHLLPDILLQKSFALLRSFHQIFRSSKIGSTSLLPSNRSTLSKICSSAPSLSIPRVARYLILHGAPPPAFSTSLQAMPFPTTKLHCTLPADGA